VETIFDLGMHHGRDTRFYLDKGFRVIALEANPELVAAAETAFAPEIAEGRLVIVGCALWHAAGEHIPFFLNREKDDWSSALRDWAEKGGHAAEEIEVPTTTLAELLDSYATPHYVKCDIEGADEIMVRQLLADRRRPAFVSVEAASAELLAFMLAAGYDRVQIVNQALLPWAEIPDPAREGRRVEVRFDGHMSGLFGHELPAGRWTDFTGAVENFLAFRDLHDRDPDLAHGWIDFHFTSADHLASRQVARQAG